MTLREFIHDDICWCANDCDQLSCERNLVNRMSKTGLFSMAYLKDTDLCPLKKGDHNEERSERMDSIL